jgi:hypothetical protein
MKTIDIDQTTKMCPDCGWKPLSKEGTTRYADLIEHVMKIHHMGKPHFARRTIFVKGDGTRQLEVAIFIRHSANPIGPCFVGRPYAP